MCLCMTSKCAGLSGAQPHLNTGRTRAERGSSSQLWGGALPWMSHVARSCLLVRRGLLFQHRKHHLWPQGASGVCRDFRPRCHSWICAACARRLPQSPEHPMVPGVREARRSAHGLVRPIYIPTPYPRPIPPSVSRLSSPLARKKAFLPRLLAGLLCRPLIPRLAADIGPGFLSGRIASGSSCCVTSGRG